MPDYNLLAAATISGSWWIPDSPERARPGELKWDASGATLSLHEAFRLPSGDVFADQIREYPVVHGRSTRAQPITLLDGFLRAMPMHFGTSGWSVTESISASRAIVGGHVDEKTCFASLTARIPGLAVWWTSRAAFGITLVEAQGSPQGMFRVEAARGAPVHMPISSMDGTLTWNIGVHVEQSTDADLHLTASGLLSIKAERPRSLDWFLERLEQATILLALLAGDSMSPDQLSLTTVDGERLQLLLPLRDARVCTLQQAFDFFLPKVVLGGEVETILSTWFARSEVFGQPMRLVHSALCSENRWLHVQFVSLMQALEAVHRAAYPTSYMSREAYEPVRQALCAAIPAGLTDGHREALKSRIKFGYEYSLQKRLGELANSLEPALRRAIFGKAQKPASEWVATRNYYTHWDEQGGESQLDPQTVHDATVRLRHFLRAVCLQLAGVPQATLLRGLNGTYRESQHLLQLNARDERRRKPQA
jgi:hypothetical protein